MVFFHFFRIWFYIFLFYIVVILINFSLKKCGTGEHDFEITSEGFIEETEYSYSLFKWSCVDKVVKIFGYIMVRVTGNQWHVIPKRAFGTKEEQDEFLLALKSKINA